MKQLRLAAEVFRQTLVLQLRSRTLLVLAALAALLLAVFPVVATRANGRILGTDLFGIPSVWVVLQFALPFAVLALAIQAVHGDLEDRTATYLFVRPVTRPAILLGKWAAIVVIGTAGGALALGGIHAILSWPRWSWRFGVGPDPKHLIGFVQAAALAVPGYAAVGVLLAARLRRPLIGAMVYLVGWEVVVSNLPPQAGVRSATVADPVRRFLVENLDLPARDGLRNALVMTLHDVDPGRLADPLLALVRFTVLTLGLALVIHARREYDSRTTE
jgi:hypothetical protein